MPKTTQTTLRRLMAFTCAHLMAASAFAQNGNPDHGFIRIDPKYPCTFAYDDGTRYFPMGDTCYDLITATKEIIAEYINSRSAHQFNFIRMGAIWNGFWPFGGTPASPDYARINETAMEKLDWVFTCAAGKNVNIELILWTYGVEGGEGLWGDETRETFWIDTLAERYRARRNLFMYTVANEFERYPTGKYSFHPADVEWAKRVAARLRSMDPVHPIGVHPSVWITTGSWSNAGWCTYNGFTQRRPQIVSPLWDNSSVNVNVVQNNEGVHRWQWIKGGVNYAPITWKGVYYPVAWTKTGWDFEGAGMEDCVAEDRASGRPVINMEFGYQYDTGPVDEVDRQLHQQGTTRKKAWKIATAGGFFAAGFKHRLVNLGNYRPEQLETLHEFFTTKTEYWTMNPRLDLVSPGNVCLALPGKEYVVYLSRGGTDSIELEAGTYNVEWLNPRTGEYTAGSKMTGGARRSFTAIDRNDWVLHLYKQQGRQK